MNNHDLELLGDLIKLQSVTEKVDNVNQVSERIFQELSSAGLYCRMEEFDGRKCLYAATVEDKQPDYLLNAHVDVVPADDEAMFQPVVRDGYIYGRGSSDCLGCCVSIVETLRRLKGKASCGAIFSADEEVGGFTTGAMVKLGYGAKKAVIVIDGSWGEIVFAQKGIIVATLTALSPTGGGHASAPWEFVNPIEMLMEDYLKIREKWQNPTAGDQWQKSIAPTVINGGFVHNQIPNKAALTMNIRFIDPAEADEIEKLIRSSCRSEVDFHIDCMPVAADPDQAETVRLQRVIADYLQQDVPLVKMNGATDARYFVDCNVPIAILGLDGNGVHSPNEYLRIDSINEMADMLEKFML